jgi:hypothetical protein
MEPSGPTRQTIKYVREHPRRALVFLALALVFLAFAMQYWHAFVHSWLIQEVWWHTHAIRQAMQYSMVTQLTCLVTLEIMGFCGVALACLRELCSACKRQPSGARLRQRLARMGQKSVEWHDHSVWTPNATLSYAPDSETAAGQRGHDVALGHVSETLPCADLQRCGHAAAEQPP